MGFQPASSILEILYSNSFSSFATAKYNEPYPSLGFTTNGKPKRVMRADLSSGKQDSALEKLLVVKNSNVFHLSLASSNTFKGLEIIFALVSASILVWKRPRTNNSSSDPTKMAFISFFLTIEIILST